MRHHLLLFVFFIISLCICITYCTLQSRFVWLHAHWTWRKSYEAIRFSPNKNMSLNWSGMWRILSNSSGRIRSQNGHKQCEKKKNKRPPHKRGTSHRGQSWSKAYISWVCIYVVCLFLCENDKKSQLNISRIKTMANASCAWHFVRRMKWNQHGLCRL